MADLHARESRRLAVVTEAFLDRSLVELLEWLGESVPEVTALELGSGGYAPNPHCDTARLLADAGERARWCDAIEHRGFTVAALNAWGNPLHPDRGLAESHDRALRETIRLAGQLGVDRVIALAGCPAAAAGDAAPHFAAGGWLPYLEGIHERQWDDRVAPYWAQISALSRAEHPELRVCLELHPGTVVYNVETFTRLAQLGDNLAANIDPSHFFWQQMDAEAVVTALGDRVGHLHAKDVVFNRAVMATEGLLDHRWPGPPHSAVWKFATVGDGHNAGWWNRLLGLLDVTEVRAVAIEHEDPDVPPETGVPAAARLLAPALEVIGA